MNDTLVQNVLIVDDSRSDLLYLQGIVKSPTRNVVTATSGRDALELLPQHDFALALLDVQLPGMNGFETAEEIRSQEQASHMPIIFVTAVHTMEEHVFKGYDAGAVDYLFKPVEPRLLRGKVQVFCELHEQQAVIQTQLSEIREKNDVLRRQLGEIEMLRGLIPICASCKKVRDDSGFWESIESYLADHIDAEFSHSICPDCLKKLYPEL